MQSHPLEDHEYFGIYTLELHRPAFNRVTKKSCTVGSLAHDAEYFKKYVRSWIQQRADFIDGSILKRPGSDHPWYGVNNTVVSYYMVSLTEEKAQKLFRSYGLNDRDVAETVKAFKTCIEGRLLYHVENKATSTKQKYEDEKMSAMSRPAVEIMRTPRVGQKRSSDVSQADGGTRSRPREV